MMRPFYVDDRSILVVNGSGVMRQLFVPFRVVCLYDFGEIRKGTTVYVECVMQGTGHQLLFQVLQQWIPHSHFSLQLSF